MTVNLAKAKSFGLFAFYNCVNLINISLPAAETLDRGVFSGCTKLEDAALPMCRQIGYECFYGTKIGGAQTFASLQTIISASGSGTYGAFYATPITEIHLPACAVIGGVADRAINGTFAACTSLTVADLPACQTIGPYTFSGCSALFSVYCPEVQVIGKNAFASCTALATIDLPSSVASIDSTAFTGCRNLLTININKPQGSISGAPWGATNAQVNWTG